MMTVYNLPFSVAYAAALFCEAQCCDVDALGNLYFKHPGSGRNPNLYVCFSEEEYRELYNNAMVNGTGQNVISYGDQIALYGKPQN